MLLLLASLLQCNATPPYQGPADQPPPLPAGPSVAPTQPSPERPSVPAPSTPGPNAPGPSTPGPAVTPGPVTGGGLGGPRTGGIDLGPQLDWRDWWWLNGYEYFRPGPRPTLATGDGGGAQGTRSGDDPEVAAARETVRRALRDRDDRVRASAAITAGRILDPSLRPALLELLADGSLLVRQCAIAGLGLAGTEESAHVLLRIGISSTLDSARAPSLEERDLALLSLGIGAHRGARARYAPALRTFLSRATSNERRALGPSSALSLALAGDDTALLEDLVAVAKDRQAPPPLRARALWGFRQGSASADALRPVALGCLEEDRDVDVRRAAALALGRLAAGAEDEVLAALRSSIDSEGDTAVRAFSLLAMGEVGGPAAKKELLERVTRGKQLIRPWAAIGAGLLGRKDRDAELGRSLAKALSEEKNKDTRAALVLGIGLAKVSDAREMVRHIVVNGEHGRERVFAAVAVALGEDEEGRPTLRRAMKDIPSPSSRATMALALSTFSNVEDLPSLLESFQSADEPGVIGTSALALAWHGTAPALETLRRDVETSKRAERRAVALLALGIGVAPERVPVSIAATGGWNYLASLEAAHTAARLWM
ncbi:MAG: HEAT repeat domain-containing protein [Planctomycetota bacterium]